MLEASLLPLLLTDEAAIAAWVVKQQLVLPQVCAGLPFIVLMVIESRHSWGCVCMSVFVYVGNCCCRPF